MPVLIDRKKFSVREVARMFGVSPNKIMAWIRAGELRAINVASRESRRPRYAIDAADIDAFEAGRQVVPDVAPRMRKVRRRAAAVKDFI
jgi:excisionase family DNA binding protein